MKKTLLILLVASLLAGCSRGDAPEYTSTSGAISVHCVDGYKFVVLRALYQGGVAQKFILTPEGKAVPDMCTEAVNNGN